MNGTDLSGDTNYPNDLSIISLRTNGNVSADRFGRDRGFNGRQWRGQLGEILIYNQALSDSEMAKIETYLSTKWDISIASNAKRYNLGAKDSSNNNHHGVLRKTFSPSDLSTLNLWLDASDSASITHSSNAVSQWNDKSGNNNHATQSTSSKQPALVANKVVFDGTDDHIISNGLNISQSYSFFIAGKTNNNSSGRDYLFDGVGSTQSHRSLIALDNSGKIQMWASSWANTNINTPTSEFVLSAIFNTTSSSFALNGTNSTGLSTGGYNLTNGITIGSNHVANNDFLKGNIAEFIILDETASLETQSKVEGYLATSGDSLKLA